MDLGMAIVLSGIWIFKLSKLFENRQQMKAATKDRKALEAKDSIRRGANKIGCLFNIKAKQALYEMTIPYLQANRDKSIKLLKKTADLYNRQRDYSQFNLLNARICTRILSGKEFYDSLIIYGRLLLKNNLSEQAASIYSVLQASEQEIDPLSKIQLLSFYGEYSAFNKMPKQTRQIFQKLEHEYEVKFPSNKSKQIELFIFEAQAERLLGQYKQSVLKFQKVLDLLIVPTDKKEIEVDLERVLNIYLEIAQCQRLDENYQGENILLVCARETVKNLPPKRENLKKSLQIQILLASNSFRRGQYQTMQIQLKKAQEECKRIHGKESIEYLRISEELQQAEINSRSFQAAGRTSAGDWKGMMGALSAGSA